MENLTSLTISSGSSGPSLVREISTGDISESLEELRLLDERGRVLAWPEVVLPLDELNVLNLSLDERIFEIVSTSPLRRLGLLSGTKLASLHGIQALPALESLRLKNLRALSDISALQALPRLTRLDIQYCRKIRGINVLAELVSLEALTLVGCGDLGITGLQDVIERIPVTTIGATGEGSQSRGSARTGARSCGVDADREQRVDARGG